MVKKIQNAGIRIAMGYRISTPINVMMTEAGVMDMESRRKLLAHRYLAKQRHRIISKPLEAMKRYVESKREDTEEESDELLLAWRETMDLEDVMEKEEGIQVSRCERTKEEDDITIEMEEIIDWKMGENTKLLPSGYMNTIINDIKNKMNISIQQEIEIYTDGSKIPNSNANGIGIIIKNNAENTWTEIGISISNKATIYTTEAVAIEKAIQIANTKYREKDVLIITDSLSVLQGLMGNDNGRRKKRKGEKNIRIGRIRESLLVREKEHKERSNEDLVTIGKIRVAWVPAHKGIPGNEKADNKAKEMTNDIPDNQIKIPLEDMKVTIMEWAWKNSNRQMKMEGNVKGIKYFKLKINNEGKRKPWFYKMHNLERGSITTLNRIRANHYNLAESLHRKGMIDSPNCECGEGIEDINHIIWHCKNYENEREILKNNLGRRGVREGEDIIERINENEPVIGRLLIGYLNKIKRSI